MKVLLPKLSTIPKPIALTKYILTMITYKLIEHLQDFTCKCLINFIIISINYSG